MRIIKIKTFCLFAVGLLSTLGYAQVIPIGFVGTIVVQGTPATIGDYRDGGVVFYVNPDDNTHGLVCSLTDIGSSNGRNIWNFVSNDSFVTNATGTAVGSGKTNTNTIIAAMNDKYDPDPALQSITSTGFEVYAAGIARNYLGEGYTDWFLPSKDELYQLFVNRVAVSNTLTTIAGAQTFPSVSNYNYWTSSESNLYRVWMLRYNGTSVLQATINKGDAKYLRAIRAF